MSSQDGTRKTTPMLFKVLWLNIVKYSHAVVIASHFHPLLSPNPTSIVPMGLGGTACFAASTASWPQDFQRLKSPGTSETRLRVGGIHIRASRAAGHETWLASSPRKFAGHFFEHPLCTVWFNDVSQIACLLCGDWAFGLRHVCIKSSTTRR
jgi:hypothetical protein